MNLEALDLFLHGKKIGEILHLPGDRNLFTFDQSYIDAVDRPTFSLSFKDVLGGLITRSKISGRRLSPFFANLLPEGPLRTFLSSQAGINPDREFFLLRALGEDLPGAIKVVPSGRPLSTPLLHEEEEMSTETTHANVLHFSLAGVQLKFSAIFKKEKLTIPARGTGGEWIVKLPSSTYPGVPENEYAMMELAARMGMDVPERRLLPLECITGLPEEFFKKREKAYVVKRFDRGKEPIHIEDFAQVFGVYPEKKYVAASYRNIVEVIASEIGEEGIQEFVRRFVFNALIGNGDMHLKNWSLIYPDKKQAALAPPYDFVSTIPYLPKETLALSFAGSKEFHSLTASQFRRFADKARLSEELVLETVRETVKRFKEVWAFKEECGVSSTLSHVIATHLRSVPIYSDTLYTIRGK